jgi:hypothetical protein
MQLGYLEYGVGPIFAEMERTLEQTERDDEVRRHLEPTLTEAVAEFREDRTRAAEDNSEFDEPEPLPSQARLAEFARLLHAYRLDRFAAIVEIALRVSKSPGYAGRRWIHLQRGSTTASGAARSTQFLCGGGVTLTYLSDLLDALVSRGIHWSHPVALDQPMWRGTPLDRCQIAPSHGLLIDLADKIPTYNFRLFSFAQAIPIQTITASNKLSLVYAFRDRRVAKPGSSVLVTGDTGFYRLSAAAARIAADCGLVKTPHHGGHMGWFPREFLTAVKSAKAPNSLNVNFFTSLAEQAPEPHDPFRDLVLQLSTLAVKGRVSTYFSNHTANPRWHLVSGSKKAPDVVEFRGRAKAWSIETKGALLYRP